jgi:hypothetical protein
MIKCTERADYNNMPLNYNFPVADDDFNLALHDINCFLALKVCFASSFINHIASFFLDFGSQTYPRKTWLQPYVIISLPWY